MPEPVPDIVVALPVTVFRGYGKAWVRGGFAMFGLLALLAFSGVDDIVYLALTGGFGVGLIVCGLVAGEVSEGMRNREVWAYVVGIGLSVAGGIGSVYRLQRIRRRPDQPDRGPLAGADRVRWGRHRGDGRAGHGAPRPAQPHCGCAADASGPATRPEGR